MTEDLAEEVAVTTEVTPEAEKTSAQMELNHEFMRYGRVIHLFRTRMSDLLPAGLDPAAAQLLAWLVKQGPSRQGELAECTFLDPSTVSRRISQLVQKGLVVRQADPIDGRAVQLVPTEHGRELFSAIRRHREQVMQEVLAHWSSGDLTALSGLLRKFNDDFETYRSTS
jgi:DNA-binding MarR family transcriptional regulator